MNRWSLGYVKLYPRGGHQKADGAYEMFLKDRDKLSKLCSFIPVVVSRVVASSDPEPEAGRVFFVFFPSALELHLVVTFMFFFATVF